MIVRPTVRRSASLLPDAGVILVLSALVYGLMRSAAHWQAPLQPQVEIDLSLWALPGYALLSLLRGCSAYVLSLAFSLAYGYLASHRPNAEKVMIPLLDVMQSIPVLGFLPGAVLALVALFPRTNIGLELSCILMIFTGQVWNMTFSVYQSMRSIPLELREASSLYQFNSWQRFRYLEVPASAVGLAWNSMMSMAGGWFFLMVCEAFTLGSHHFQLPGLGAYMSAAIAHKDLRAILAGISAMVVMIALVDACLWRPVLCWVQKFRIEETAAGDVRGSAVLNWLRRSRVVQAAMDGLAHPLSAWLASRARPRRAARRQRAPAPSLWMGFALKGAFVWLAGGVFAWALWRFGRVLTQLSLQEWSGVWIASFLTFLRVVAAVMLGSVWTVPVGIWIGSSQRRRARLQPFVQIAASFPAPMLYPLVLLVLHHLGIGLGIGAIFLMLLGTQWYLLFNVIAGASMVPHELREVARSYQFTFWQRWWIVWWPAVFPSLITGWITSAGGAWNASIVAEYVSLGNEIFVAAGLGSLISTAASQGRYDLLANGVLTMAIVVIAIGRSLWKPLYRLAETRYAY